MSKVIPKRYPISIGTIQRELPVINVGEVSVALLNLLGDSELTEAAAQALIAKMPEDVNILVTPEAKAIPLAHSISVKAEIPYVVARKTAKPYMISPVTKTVLSITTGKPQNLVIDGFDISRLQGRKVAIVDDVVSTGGTLKGLSEMLREIGAHVIAIMAVLTEGDPRDDIITLGHLPLFAADEGI